MPLNRQPKRHPALDWDDDRRTRELERLLERRVPGATKVEKQEWIAAVTDSSLITVRAWFTPDGPRRVPPAALALLIWALDQLD